MAQVVIYIVTGYSKLKTLVSNIALQCIKTVEAAALNPNYIICENGLEKILLVINLAILTIMTFAKLWKSRIFKGKLFSNTIKVKLFVADNHCYILLHPNKLAGSVHLFKLHGILTKENLILKKNWIWDVLEIDLTDAYLLQDHKEINLLVTVVIPIYYKYKLRQLLKKSTTSPLQLYIMLKQRKSWLNLEVLNVTQFIKSNVFILFYRMNQPQPLCISLDFQGYMVYQIPADALQVELKIKTKWGKFILHMDQFTRTEKYRVWRKVNRCKIHSRRKHLSDSHLYIPSDSSMFINHGQGLGYPPKTFIDSDSDQKFPPYIPIL